MKTIIGSLPVNKEYTITELDYCPADCGTVCDNCGRYISNIATITDGKNDYCVGLDCAESLKGCGIGESWEIMEAKKKIARMARFVRWFKKSCKFYAYWDGDKSEILFYDFEPSKWDSRYKYRYTTTDFTAKYPYLELPTHIFS